MRWWPLVGALVLGAVGTAHADGVCVAIDVGKDNLVEGERYAVRVAIQEALAKEGVQVDRQGFACRGQVTAWSVKLGNRVTVTLLASDGKRVHGDASSLDEVDLLVSQLVRSLITGRSLATGFGVTDRYNVLRDQTAPRRSHPSDRRWDPVVAIGGGMLQLPATETRARQRQYNIVSLEGRAWGFLGPEDNAIEVYGRMLLHDYAVVSDAKAKYDAHVEDNDHPKDELHRGAGLVFSPFAVANYEAGIGFVKFLGASGPRPFVRVGGTMSVLFRLSDPEHRFDVGFGGYVGVGFRLSDNVNLSVAANVSNPVVHDFLDSGYWYFLTTTAMLEIRGRGRAGEPPPSIFRESEPAVDVQRRINE